MSECPWKGTWCNGGQDKESCPVENYKKRDDKQFRQAKGNFVGCPRFERPAYTPPPNNQRPRR